MTLAPEAFKKCVVKGVVKDRIKFLEAYKNMIPDYDLLQWVVHGEVGYQKFRKLAGLHRNLAKACNEELEFLEALLAEVTLTETVVSDAIVQSEAAE